MSASLLLHVQDQMSQRQNETHSPLVVREHYYFFHDRGQRLPIEMQRLPLLSDDEFECELDYLSGRLTPDAPRTPPVEEVPPPKNNAEFLEQLSDDDDEMATEDDESDKCFTAACANMGVIELPCGHMRFCKKCINMHVMNKPQPECMSCRGLIHPTPMLRRLPRPRRPRP